MTLKHQEAYLYADPDPKHWLLPLTPPPPSVTLLPTFLYSVSSVQCHEKNRDFALLGLLIIKNL